MAIGSASRYADLAAGVRSSAVTRALGIVMLAAAAASMAVSVSASGSDSAMPAAGGAPLAIESTDRALTVAFVPSVDNPAGMAGRDASGHLTMILTSNGVADHGIQADSVYTYRDLLRVTNTASTARGVRIAGTLGAEGHDLELAFSLRPFDGVRCGGVSPGYAASREAVRLAPGDAACVSIRLTAGTNATTARALRVQLSTEL